VSEVIRQIVDRAIQDQAFRQLLYTNLDQALEAYSVTVEERTLLESLSEDTFDDFAGGLGDRSTKGFLPGTG
jgi:hypothetical protein